MLKIFRSFFFYSMLLLLFGQLQAEQSILIGTIENRTSQRDFNQIYGILHRKLSLITQFPEMIVDSTIHVDSFPDEKCILKARGMNASFLMWGGIDSFETGTGITIDILDMVQGTVSHITVSITSHQNCETVAEILLSKLLLWFQRTTMVQLIITTQPSMATVIIDEAPIGTTPFEGMVLPGNYSLALSKKGVSTVSIPVSFVKGNTYQYDLTLGTIDTRIDKRCLIRWLGVSTGCLGAGFIAHWQRSRAQSDYQKALPPAEFDKLYRRVIAWEVGRDVLFASAGAAICVIMVKVIF